MANIGREPWSVKKFLRCNKIAAAIVLRSRRD
jgi:hypothetical protein